MVTRPACGIPAAPMLAAVAVMLGGRAAGEGGAEAWDLLGWGLPDGDDLAEVHLHVVDLGDEDGGQGLVQRRPVHVDGGPHRQHEARDALVDPVVLLQTLEGHREGG